MRRSKISQGVYAKNLANRAREELLLRGTPKVRIYAPSATEGEIAIASKHFKLVYHDTDRDYLWFEARQP